MPHYDISHYALHQSLLLAAEGVSYVTVLSIIPATVATTLITRLSVRSRIVGRVAFVFVFVLVLFLEMLCALLLLGAPPQL